MFENRKLIAVVCSNCNFWKAIAKRVMFSSYSPNRLWIHLNSDMSMIIDTELIMKLSFDVIQVNELLISWLEIDMKIAIVKSSHKSFKMITIFHRCKLYDCSKLSVNFLIVYLREWRSTLYHFETLMNYVRYRKCIFDDK